MSKTIDEQVVQMSFDNSKFESNVKTSLSTIENLKKSLNFEGAGKGLEKSMGKLDFSAVQNGLDAVTNKFSVLGTIGDQVIRNITNKVMALGEQMVSAITIDPLKDGLKEYETQMDAVQTILSNTKSKGTTIDDVNQALDDLNAYADKTIYNFTQMTKNIGTFTAAGLDLETSTQSIKGIANLAAVSGSTSQQASTAMYQLSQALATGTVKLQDWNSVVNAGMGGEIFQEALKRTSRVLGTGVDEAIEKYGTFRESLTQGGWLTTEVLSETLKQLAGSYSEADLVAKGYNREQIEQILQLAETAEDAATKVKTFTQLIDTLKEALGSGWTQTWEYIIGDFEKAKALWTGVSDVLGGIIGKVSDERNNMLKEWSDFGGRQSLIMGFKYAFEALLAVILPIKDAFTDIFPPTTATTLIKITATFREFMKNLMLTKEQAYTLRGIAQGVFGAIKIAIDLVVKAATKAKETFSDLAERSGFNALISNVVQFAGKLGYLISDIAKFGLEANSVKYKFEQLKNEFPIFGTAVDVVATAFTVLKSIIESVASVLKVVVDLVVSFGKAAAGGFSSAFSFLSEKIDTSSWMSLSDILAKIREKAVSVSDVIKGAASKIESFGATVGSIFGGIANAIGTAFNVIGSVVSPIIDKISAKFKEIFQGFNLASASVSTMGMTGTLAGIAVLLDSIKGPADSIKDLFTSIKDEILGGEGFIGKIKSTCSAISDAFKGLGDVFDEWQKKIQVDYIRNIAVSIAILAGSLVVLSMVETDKLLNSILSLEILFTSLIGATKGLDMLKISGDLQAVGKAMIIMSGAILILALAVRTIGKLEPEKLMNGILGVVVLLTAMTASIAALNAFNVEQVAKGMGGLLMFALAIRVLAGAVKALSGLDFNELEAGLIGVGSLIAGMAGFMVMINGSQMNVGSGVALLAMAAAIRILAGAVKEFGAMDTNQLVQGLVAVGSVLIMFGGVANMLAGATTGLVGAGIAMIAMAAGMKILVGVIQTFGTMDFNQLVQGMTAFAGTLVAMTAALGILGLIGPAVLAGGAALLIASVGILALAGALRIMDGIGDVGKVLLALGVALGELALGLTAMIVALPGAAALAVAAGALALIAPVFVILGKLKLAEIGKALLAIVGVFAVLGGAALLLTPILPILLGLAGALILFGSAVALAGVGLLAVGAGLTALATGLTMLGAMAATQCQMIAQSLKIIITAVAEMIPFVLEKVGEGLTALLNLLIQNMPLFVQFVSVTIQSILQAITANIPGIMSLISTLITQLVQFIVQKVPEFANAVLQIILGILNTISTNLPLIIQAGVNIVVGFITGIGEAIPQVVEAAFQMVISFMNGIGDAFRENGPAVGEAARNMFEGIIEGIVGAIIPGGNDIVAEFAKCIDNTLKKISEFVGDFVKAGENLVQGLIDGIGNLAGNVWDAAKSVGKMAVDSMANALGENSPSKIATQQGEYYDEGLINGITGSAGLVDQAVGKLGDSMIKKLDASNATAIANEKAAGIEMVKAVSDTGTQVNSAASTKAEERVDIQQKSNDEMISSMQDLRKAGAAIHKSNEADNKKHNETLLNDQKDYESKSQDSQRNYVRSWLDNLSGGSKETTKITKETSEKVGEDTEYTYKTVTETINGITTTYQKKVPKIKEQQDKAVENGEKAATKATKGKKAFVASDNELWKKLLEQRKNGVDGLKYKDMELAKFEEETLNKTSEILKNYTENSAEEARKMTNQGLFSKVSEKAQVSKEELVKNLQDQINQINEYTNVMNSLNGRISSTALKDAINEMGVESLGELQALNSMTDEELTNYTNLYDQKYAASLSQLKSKAQNELSNLYGGVPINIDAFAATFDGSLKSIEAYFTSPNTQAKVSSSGKYITEGVAEGMSKPEALQSINTAASGVEEHTEQAIKESFGINSPAEATKPHGEFITQGVAEGMKDATALQAIQDACTLLMDKVIESFDSATQAKGISSNSLSFTKALEQAVTDSIKDMTNKAKEFNKIGVLYLTELIKGVKSKTPELKTSINNCVKSMVDTLLAKKPEFLRTGQAYMAAFIEGVLSKQVDLNTTVSSIFENLVSNMQSNQNSFREIGTMFTQGLIEGIKEKSSDLYKEIAKIVKEAIKTAKKAAKEKSPSKETYSIGQYLTIGLTNGVSSMSKVLNNTVESVTEEAMQGFHDVLSALSGIEDFDSTPTIAPVMDLTGIQNGVYAMGQMLDKNKSYKLVAGISGNLESRRTAKLNEMTSLRRALNSVNNSNSVRTAEMEELQRLVKSLDDAVANQTHPDYSELQSAINNLNQSLNNQSMPDYSELESAIKNLNDSLNNQSIPDYSSLQGAIDNLNESLNNQTNPDYTSLQNAIDNLNISLQNHSMPDYTELQTAIGNLNQAISNQSSPDYSPLQSAIDNLNISLANQTGGSTEINNTFNIQSNDPKAVADEVNRSLQKMVNRRNAVWA